MITRSGTLKLGCIVGQNAALNTAESWVAEFSTSFLRISKLLELHESEVEVLKHRSKPNMNKLMITYLLIVITHVPMFFSMNSESSR